ncbi:PepSY domain-containing protein [Janthinobacterium sp. PC23-8]|uniref:PepSY-associated TM helix domain-containing protein n=1 Tax=Janthinobacterium sp. PC23-8 TaxID=2012679 RepID=UPI000B964CE5|nr:PepSY-associated TM helix domain-containing protein [Janthinobacterium sp. PC23-8]OYO28137.1 peptidase [Janthinobacterium sp. PC23-8]
MRTPLVLLHRWFGLALALFLFISGLTGAVISWDHELDAWLNPQLFQAASGKHRAGTKNGLQLARQVEANDARLRVNYTLTALEPGHAALMSVEGRLDPASGKPYALGFNQLAVDPVTGKLQGTRQWGEVSLARENLLPFLYKLHYTMHIPDARGIELGVWFMGMIGIVWFVDCFIALYLSFPNLRSWRKSLAFRWREKGHRLNFDLHRSGGVWVWLLLLILAVTSISMNLPTQVMRPLVAKFSTLSPNAFDSRTPQPPEKPVEPLLTREQVVALAKTEATRRGWTLPAGGVFYSSGYGLYGVGFFEADNDHGDGGLGNAWLYFDGRDGSPAGGVIPGTGSAGDIFLQSQFPLHSGRIIGLPGRILISAMGLMVAMLSATGLIIWLRKRRARLVKTIQL